MRWIVREKRFKPELVARADIHQNHRVLDLGCGTATLSMLIKEKHPLAEVIGLDADPGILAIARRKIDAAGLEIELKVGLSFQLDFADRSFDRVLSSLLFHHLTPENKLRTLAEIHRILKPGGELHLADLGKPKNALMRAGFLLVQLLDGFATTTDSVRGKLPEYMQHSAFRDVEEVRQFATVFGSLSLYRGRRA